MDSEKDNRSTLIKAGIAVVLIIGLLLCLIILALTRFTRSDDNGSGDNGGGNGTDANVTATLDPGIPQLTIDANDPENWNTYIDHTFFFMVDYPPFWEFEPVGRGFPPEAVRWKSDDNSEFLISYERNTTRSLNDYLRKLDFTRSTELDGEPSVEVNSSVEFDVNGMQAVQRSETDLEDEINTLVVYLSVVEEGIRPINNIFSFTIIPVEGMEPEQTQIYTDYLNSVGTFIYKPYRFTVRGEIVTGREAQIDWCTEGYYIDFPGGISGNQRQFMYLRSIGEDDYPPFNGRNYLGQSVRIEGIYQPDKELCFDLTCGCEDYMIVEDISLINPIP